MEFMSVVAASSTMRGSLGIGGAASRKSHSTTSSEIGPSTSARLRMSLAAAISYCVHAPGSANAVTIFSTTTASIFATGVSLENREVSRSSHSRDRFVQLCVWSRLCWPFYPYGHCLAGVFEAFFHESRCTVRTISPTHPRGEVRIGEQTPDPDAIHTRLIHGRCRSQTGVAGESLAGGIRNEFTETRCVEMAVADQSSHKYWQPLTRSGSMALSEKACMA